MAAQQGILNLVLKDFPSLYEAYMPFIRNGGLFIQTSQRYRLGVSVFVLLTLPESSERTPVAGKIVWTTPLGAQGNWRAGIGVQFPDGNEGVNLRNRIETLLAGKVSSDRQTFTM